MLLWRRWLIFKSLKSNYPFTKNPKQFIIHFHSSTSKKLTKLTHQNILSTLKKNPNDFISLTFFLWSARQPNYFHDRHACNHMLGVLSRLLHNSSLHELIKKLQKNEISVNFLILLRVFWHGGMYDLVFQVFDEMHVYDFVPNTFATNVVIDTLFKVGRSDTALEVFRSTQTPNFVTFSLVLSNLCKLNSSKNLVNVRDVLRKMLRKGYYLDDKMFSYVLDCFCKSGRMRNGLELVGLMVSLGYPVLVNVWTILIDGFCKKGDVAMAGCLFEKMVECGCSPNVVTCTSFVKGLLDFKMPDKALRILSIMESKGCAPDLVLCNMLINSFSKLGRYDDALDIYFSLQRRNLVPDSYTFSAIILTVCLSRQYDLLPLLISGICVQVDLTIANSLLCYFCKAGYPSGAVDLYNDMTNRGFVPDAYSYAGLVTGLCGMGRVNEAVNVYNTILDNGICIDPHLLTIVVDGLVSSGNLHRAVNLFKKAVEKKYPPLDVVSYTAVIQGLIRGGGIQDASDLFIQMKENGVAPNAFTYNLMVYGFCRVEDVKMVRVIVNEMVDKGVVLNCRSFNMVKDLIFGLCRAHSSLSLFHEICHSNSVADKALGALIIKSLLDCEILQNVDSSGSDDMSDVAVAMG